MTGLGLSETKPVVDSELAVGHLVFKVADLKEQLPILLESRHSSICY
jgi:hypothetical protein